MLINIGLAISWVEEERSGISGGIVVDSLPLVKRESASLYSAGKDWIRRSMLNRILIIMFA
jgi:hypothetical protein